MPIGVTHRRQMSSSDGQAHGQGHRILVVGSARIADTLHDKDQDESDERLNDHCLSGGDQRIHSSHAQVANQLGGSCHLKVTRRNVNKSTLWG